MIRIDSITLAYNERTILEGASLHLRKGELCALVGRNGAGKSTLLRAITTSEGVTIDGRLLTKMSAEDLARTVAIVTTETVRVANLRLRDVVAMGRAPYTNWIGRLQDIDREIVDEAIALVGMTTFAERDVATLSDGELQRAMIARAIAQQTPVILLDEPCAYLDIPTRFEVCRLLKRLAEGGKCILFSTHDVDSALSVCDSVAIIDEQHITKLPTAEAHKEIERIFGIK